MKPVVHHGDCTQVMSNMPANSVHAIVCDPPYGLEFMGKAWDAPWAEAGINSDAGFGGGGISATKNAPSFTGSTNPNCLSCGGKRRGRRDGTAIVAVCVCEMPQFPNVRAIEMRAFGSWCEEWAAECLRVLKPGGYLLAFGGTRTWHRLAVAVEDAGFEIRDSIAWLYGQGFPKSHSVARGIEKRLTVPETPLTTDDARKWQGWGTALKPAHEPIVVARKPLVGTVSANVQQHGTGALNIDATRISPPTSQGAADSSHGDSRSCTCPSRATDRTTRTPNMPNQASSGSNVQPAGRWPPNVALDESQAAALDEQSGVRKSGAWDGQRNGTKFDDLYGEFAGARETPREASQGGASRFMYVAKASNRERPKVNGIAHSTVKPLTLMRWLVRLVTPPGGTVLDPFAGSGTTIEAAILEGFDVIGIEREADYLPLIQARIDRATQDDDEPEQGALEFPA